MGFSIEVIQLPGLKAYEGIGAELDESPCVGRQSPDACRSDVMGLFCEALLDEVLTACLDHPRILSVHIADIEPCANTVVS